MRAEFEGINPARKTSKTLGLVPGDFFSHGGSEAQRIKKGFLARGMEPQVDTERKSNVKLGMVN